jgi:hypothetical protein
MRGARPGSPYPIFIAGIKYRSVLSAAEQVGLSQVWLQKSIDSSGGGPVIVKRQMVVPEAWVRGRINALMEVAD